MDLYLPALPAIRSTAFSAAWAITGGSEFNTYIYASGWNDAKQADLSSIAN